MSRITRRRLGGKTAPPDIKLERIGIVRLASGGYAMSFTLELRGSTTAHWPMSTACIDDMDRVQGPDANRDIWIIFGAPETQDGEVRTLARGDLLEAIDRLIPLAKALPGGFQIRSAIAGMQEPIISGGSGVVIGGINYAISCQGNFWCMQTLHDLMHGKQTPQYEPAEIVCEVSKRTYSIERKPSSTSDLLKLLRKMKKFLVQESRETIQVIWG